MAYIRKRKDSYKVEIRKKGHPHINRSFIDLKTARKFARDIESLKWSVMFLRIIQLLLGQP
jgi:hypothetical protein